MYLRLYFKMLMFCGISIASVQLDSNGRQLRPSIGASVTLEPKARCDTNLPGRQDRVSLKDARAHGQGQHRDLKQNRNIKV